MKKLSYDVYALGAGMSKNKDDNNIYIDGDINNGKITKINSVYVNREKMLEDSGIDENMIKFLNDNPGIQSDRNTIYGIAELTHDYGILADWYCTMPQFGITTENMSLEPCPDWFWFCLQNTLIIPVGTEFYAAAGDDGKTYKITMIKEFIIPNINDANITIPSLYYTYEPVE